MQHPTRDHDFGRRGEARLDGGELCSEDCVFLIERDNAGRCILAVICKDLNRDSRGCIVQRTANDFAGGGGFYRIVGLELDVSGSPRLRLPFIVVPLAGKYP